MPERMKQTERNSEMEQRIEARIADAASIAIVGHVHPDGDCLGSCLGMYHYLRGRYPEKTIQVYLEPFPKRLGILPGADRISHDFTDGKTYSLCLCMDTADRERLGGASVYLDRADHSICMDHHITNTRFAEENLVEPWASSASEVAASRMDLTEISRETAECLYLGIVHDTGVFRHSNTGERTMRIAGALVAKGIPFSQIIERTFYEKSLAQNRVIGYSLMNARLYCGGKMIGCALSESKIRQCGATPMDMDGIIDLMRETENVETAVLLYETEPGNWKISMRSNEIVDVSRIAQHFGGGGHVRAAGGRSTSGPDQTLEEIAAEVNQQLQEAEQSGS